MRDLLIGWQCDFSQLSEAYSAQSESFKALSSLSTEAEKFIASELLSNVPIELTHHPYFMCLFKICLLTVSITRIVNSVEIWVGCSVSN